MPFLVYERDPLVLSDICDTVKDAFPDSGVMPVESAALLNQLSAEMRRPFVAILSVLSDELGAVLSAIDYQQDTVRLVVISNDADSHGDIDGVFAHLARPFSAQNLIAAIKSAHGDLPEALS